MKRALYITILAIVLGCSGDDDTNVIIPLTGIDGVWNLINVTGGFVGTDHDFESGLITWDFEESSQTVTITNNNTDDTLEDSFPSGTYTYTIITAQGGNQEILVDGRNIGNFELTSNQFTIDETFRDGFRFTFRR